MTDPYPHSPVRRYRRGAAATAAAALAGTMLAPALATGPAAAAPDCDEALPYRAAAHADLLRLHALDLPLLKLGPLADARIASSGAGMVADGTPASAAAARDLELNLLGNGLVTPLLAEQVAPPSNDESAADSRLHLELPGLLRVDVGNVDAHATWDDPMYCGAEGTASVGTASLVDAALVPGIGNRALVALPDNLASSSRTALVDQDGTAAAQATAAASLADLRVFAGFRSEIGVRVLSEPTLEVTATGDADSSSVRYESPVLQVSIPGVGVVTLDAANTSVDIGFAPSGNPPADGAPLPFAAGPDPLAELLQALDPALGGLHTDGAATGQVLSHLPLSDPGSVGHLPVLGDVVSEVASLGGLNELSLLRLSLGELEQDISDESVSAAAASVRLQLLRWEGGSGPADQAKAVLDLGIGLLSATAEAPQQEEGEEQPDPSPAPPGAGGEVPEESEQLPVTGPTLGLIAGFGVLLAVAGRLLLLMTRGNRLNRGLTG